MDCIACCSSAAALGSSFRAPLLSTSVEDCSTSVMCSVVSLLRCGGSRRFAEGLLHSRASPPVRSVGSSPRTSAAFASAVETEDVSSPHAGDEESDGQNLSAKERRKLRNERREAAKLAQEQPWRAAVEDKLLEKKKKIRNWQEDADINQCIAKGVQWWMIQTTRKFEFDVAEQIEIIFPESFPGREFEVIVPTVPVKTKLKDGSVSQSRKKVYEGIVLLRCLLDRDVYFTIKKIPRAYEFFGTQAGLSVQPVVMPAPVSNFNMEIMFQRIRKQEEEYEEFKEQCRLELEEKKKEQKRKNEEKKRRDLEQETLKSKRLILSVGSTVRVLSGPFLDFAGIVTELLPQNKVKAIVTVFGNDTPIVLDVADVAVESAASDEKRAQMFNP